MAGGAALPHPAAEPCPVPWAPRRGRVRIMAAMDTPGPSCIGSRRRGATISSLFRSRERARLRRQPAVGTLLLPLLRGGAGDRLGHVDGPARIARRCALASTPARWKGTSPTTTTRSSAGSMRSRGTSCRTASREWALHPRRSTSRARRGGDRLLRRRAHASAPRHRARAARCRACRPRRTRRETRRRLPADRGGGRPGRAPVSRSASLYRAAGFVALGNDGDRTVMRRTLAPAPR